MILICFQGKPFNWRRKWQPTPVFLPGESQGQGSLVGCHLRGHTESDRLKRLSSSSSSKPFNITVIQVYAPTTNAEEAEVEQFYEDLHDLPEVTPKKDVCFIIGDWNKKVGNQEIPGVTGKFGLGVQNEAGQRPTEFCQENTPSSRVNPLSTTQEMTLHMDITRWSILKSN